MSSHTRLSVTRFTRWLWIITAILSAVGFAIVLARYVEGVALPEVVGALFDLDNEQTISTWYSSALLAVGGTIALYLGSGGGEEGRRLRRMWTILGAALWVFSLDETVSLHERAGLGLAGTGALHFGWVLPALIGVAAFGLWYLVGFLRHLEPRLRGGILLAASVYVGAALGIEFLEGMIVDGLFPGSRGEDTLIYNLASATQETLEMAGLVIFVYVTLAYLQRRRGRINVELVIANPVENAAGPGSLNPGASEQVG
jgi:hypothetical protein